MPVFVKKKGVYIPTVLGTFIDKITITCNFPVKDQYQIVDDLEDLTLHGPKSGYDIARYIPLGTKFFESDGDKNTDSKLLIQCGPAFPNAKFLRIEWNPERIPAEDICAALLTAFHGMSLYERIMTKGTVTRLDVAVDVANLAIDDFVFHRPGIRVTRMECASGKTLYLGSEDSECGTVIYDKRAELKAKNKKKPKAIKSLPDTWATTRIEQRLRPKTSLAVAAVTSLANPFQSLVVSGYAGLAGKNEVWSMFLDSVRLRTAPAALQRIKNARMRAEYAKRFGEATAAWWHPEEIWPGVKPRIDDLLAAVP